MATIESLMNLPRQKTAQQAQTDHAQAEELLQELLTLRNQVADLKSQLAEVQSQAPFCPLTKVGNKQAMLEELTKAISCSRRTNRLHGFLYIDINDFSALNNRLGTTVGDQLLQHVAHVLRQNIRTTDVVARLQNDDFAVLLTEIQQPNNADARAEALTQIIRQTPLAVHSTEGGRTVALEVSIGSLTFSSQYAPEEIIDLAFADLIKQR